jgi:hypothetical protein
MPRTKLLVVSLLLGLLGAILIPDFHATTRGLMFLAWVVVFRIAIALLRSPTGPGDDKEGRST